MKNVIYFLALLKLAQISAQNEDNLTAKLNLFQKDIFVQIDATITNNTHIYKEKLSYQIVALVRQGETLSYDKTERNGKIDLLPNENKTIDSYKFNVNPDEELKVYLFIRDGDNLVATDSLKINEVSEILKTTSIKENEIEIIGLVVENAKTKMGKDFYDFLYQKYRMSGINYPFVINVEEKPFLGGRGSLISLIVEDNKIFEFQARPDEELLMNAAEYGLTLLTKYAKSRSTVEKIY